MGTLRALSLTALLALGLYGCDGPASSLPPERPRPPLVESAQNVPGVFQGEVVAMGCYLRQGAKGEAHRPCAEACLKKGMPAGLLKSGQVLLLLAKEPGTGADFSAFAARQCEVHGNLLHRTGMFAVEVSSITVLPESKGLPPPGEAPTIPP